MPRTLSRLCVASVLFAALAGPAAAQSGKPPRTYSFRATVSMMSDPLQVKVNRTGGKELMEISLPAQAGASGGLHQRLLYDFDAHLVYASDLIGKTCTVQQYGSSYAPTLYDPIGDAESAQAEMAKRPPRVLRRETVNGIPTKLVEAPVEDGQGRAQIWLDEKYGFPVRMALALGKEPPTTRLELSQLSYAASPASLFVPPTGCTRMGGVSTAEGGHAEMTVNVEASAEGARVEVSPTSEPKAEPPAAPVEATPAEAAPSHPTQITAVTLRVVPARMRAPCPGKVQLIGEFTTDGPGTIWYQFLAGAISSSPEGSLTFKSAGTQTVTVEGRFNNTPQVKEAQLLAAMQNERGEHGPDTVSSEPVEYDIVCTAR